MDTPPDSQRKAWARLSTLTSFVSRICFFKARCSDSDSVNGFIVIPPAFDFTRVRLGGVKKILSTYLEAERREQEDLRKKLDDLRREIVQQEHQMHSLRKEASELQSVVSTLTQERDRLATEKVVLDRER